MHNLMVLLFGIKNYLNYFCAWAINNLKSYNSLEIDSVWYEK